MFLDILGFTSIVEESRSNPKLVNKIANMLKRSRERAIFGSRLEATRTYPILRVLEVDPNQYIYHAFSDMIVISAPYISHDYMQFLSWWTMWHQYDMWKEDQTFSRGAMVYGDIYEDKDEYTDIIFGPALIDAYRLEDKKATWPRVLIDGSLLDATKKEELERDFYEFIRQDDDKLVYLDYLRELFHLFIVAENNKITGKRQRDFGEPTKLFKDHKEAILTQVHKALNEEKKDKDGKVIKKYEALSKYHNSTVDKLRQVTKDLINNNSLIREFFDDLIKSYKAKNSGSTYEPKYSAEEHPEQTDILDIIGLLLNRITENPPPDILEIRDIIIIRQTEEAGLERAFRNIFSEVPRELLKLDKDLQELVIDIDSFGLEKKRA